MASTEWPRRALDTLPAGARAAFEEQWRGLATGGLPCGAAITDAAGRVVTSGRNHAYDAAGPLASREHDPLQFTRLAHAELNAIAHLPTDADHGRLTVWTTQHPCSMCAAAIAFTGIGAVRYIADDPSDHCGDEDRLATRAGVPYTALDEPFWWLVANVLFLSVVVVRDGAAARNLASNRDRFPELVALTLQLAETDALGNAARAGLPLIDAVIPHVAALTETAQRLRRPHPPAC